MMSNLGTFDELTRNREKLLLEGESGIIHAMNKIPAFKMLYKRSPILTHEQVGDPKMVGKHTNLVLNQFNSQRRFFDLLNAAAEIRETTGFERFNINAFMTVLIAIHDIGKFLGKDATDQHDFITPILRETLAALGFSEKEINLAAQFVNNDILGD